MSVAKKPAANRLAGDIKRAAAKDGHAATLDRASSASAKLPATPPAAKQRCPYDEALDHVDRQIKELADQRKRLKAEQQEMVDRQMGDRVSDDNDIAEQMDAKLAANRQATEQAVARRERLLEMPRPQRPVTVPPPKATAPPAAGKPATAKPVAAPRPRPDAARSEPPFEPATPDPEGARIAHIDDLGRLQEPEKS